MDETQVISAEAPVTQDEQEQARGVLRALTRVEGAAEDRRASAGVLAMVGPLVEVCFAMAVRSGHTGLAVAGVPVSRADIITALGLLSQLRDTESAIPDLVLGQKVRYHGSLTTRHGEYWVGGFRFDGSWEQEGSARVVRYELRSIGSPLGAPVLTHVRRRSLTPLAEYLAL
ncbi:hypothetical protein [Streptomyces flavofungini]|uniref:Uncharacterized protein n=1 Tax=Streptomyces flavofungini TaxID=68200 RepID=A0ABS0XGJ1_9ACTN|nr:hypothetical protein [Streptomyces flavofungini]MBJ3812300.1 hypothetical protein [Streptomyces flavofungini]GHC88612.1 hypothetical protein GCM10010349_76010 [Streptomyces flavofungini]